MKDDSFVIRLLSMAVCKRKPKIVFGLFQLTLEKRIAAQIITVSDLLADGEVVQYHTTGINVGDKCLTHAYRVELKVDFECKIGDMKDT